MVGCCGRKDAGWHTVAWGCHGGLGNFYGGSSQIAFSLCYTCTQKSEGQSPRLWQVVGGQVPQQVSSITGKALEGIEGNSLVLFLELPPC